MPKRKWDNSYQAVFLAHRGHYWGFWLLILMRSPPGRLGPLELEKDSVGTQEEVGNVQGWKSRLGVPEYTR